MFSITPGEENGFHQLVLKDQETGTAVTLIPGNGGALRAFTFQSPGGPVNIIEHYEDLSDWQEHLAEKGFKSCKLSPFACRLYNGTYEFAGKSLKFNRFYLGPHALHGILYDAPFVVEQTFATDKEAAVTLLYIYDVSEPGFPFPYNCRVTYRLKSNNNLIIKTLIENTGNGAFPIQDGWHPYFTWHKPIDSLRLTIRSQAKVETNNDLIPNGKSITYTEFSKGRVIGDTHLDDCFILEPGLSGQAACILRDEVANCQLEIYANENYPYLQVYTPDHRQSIAIENLSAAPDAFNNGMGTKILQPGESVSFETRLAIRPGK